MSNQIKSAKAILDKRGIRTISPGQLTRTAAQLHKSLEDTLRIIAFMKSGSQGYGPFPHTMRLLKGRYQ